MAESASHTAEVMIRSTVQKKSTVKHCLTCGKRIVNRPKALYCSDSCRAKKYRQLNKGQKLTKREEAMREKIFTPHRCQRCNKLFHMNGRGQPAKYCSPGCKVLYSRERQRAAYKFYVRCNGDEAAHVDGLSLAEMVKWCESERAEYHPDLKAWFDGRQMSFLVDDKDGLSWR